MLSGVAVAILAQASAILAHAGLRHLWIEVFILRPCKPASMPRKGWTVMKVPNGWHEVLRGPQPPSVRWPTVSPAVEEAFAQQPTQKSVPVQRTPPMRSSPEVATEAAPARATALEAAIGALADGAALKSLQEALQKAEQSAHVPPLGTTGRVPPFHRARQEARRQSRCGVVEASIRARSVVCRVGRRSAARSSWSSGPHSTSSTEGFGFRTAEDAGSDRRLSAGTIPVGGCTPFNDPMKRNIHQSFVGSCPVSAVFRHIRSTQKEQYQQPQSGSGARCRKEEDFIVHTV